MSFLKTWPFPFSTNDVSASPSHIVHARTPFSNLQWVEVMKRKNKSLVAEGEPEGKQGRQVCVTCLELCMFGSSSNFPPLIPPHLHRNVQLDLIREAQGEIKLGVRPKYSIWGQAWSCDLIDPRGRQQRQSVSIFWWKRASLCLCNHVSLCVWVCWEEEWEGKEDVNASLRWQQQHSHTQTCVWHQEGVESISCPTTPFSSSFSCCAVQTLKAALNPCQQAPGGEGATPAVPLPPGLAWDSLSFPKRAAPLLFLLLLPLFFGLTFALLFCSLASPPPCFMTVYVNWRLLLSSPACGSPKQINKFMRTHIRTHIHSQTACAHHTGT